MYVDSNLVLATSDDMRASSQTPIVGGFLYVSDTVDLGTGSKGLPFQHAFLRITCDVAFNAITPPCLVTVRLISGDLDSTLLTDLALGSFSQHYQTETTSTVWTAGYTVVNVPIPATPAGYQRYLGVALIFSGDGLDDGTASILINMNPNENRPMVDALPS